MKRPVFFAAPARLLAAGALLGPGSLCAAANLAVENWTSTLRPTYLEVPAYQSYKKVQLQVKLLSPAGPPPQVELRLDGRPLARAPLRSDLTFALPDLAPGGHVLRLRTLGKVLPGECAELGRDLPITGAQLQFVPLERGRPSLHRLPAGLYQPELNSVVVGQISAPQWTPPTMQAALGLAQLLSAERPVVWQSNLGPALPADFTVELLRRPQLAVPARLELRPGVLRVLYRQDDDLRAAVHTLASAGLRRGLRGPDADVRRTPELPPAELSVPQTLGDLGLRDYRVWSGQNASEQALKLPPLWEPGGPVSGQLHYFVPTPRTGRESVQLRLGSQTGQLGGDAQPGGGFLARFRGDAPGPGQALAFAVSTDNLSHCGASVRVASDSAIDFHARLRSGLALLPRLLSSSPVVRLPKTAGDIDLALNVAASLRGWGLRGTLPWEVQFGPGETRRRPTLVLQRAPAGHAAEAQLHSPWLVKPEFRLLTPTPQASQELAAYWQRVPGQLSDHLGAVRILPGGEVTLRAQDRPVPDEVPLRVLGFSFLALPVAGLGWGLSRWLGRRKR